MTDKQSAELAARCRASASEAAEAGVARKAAEPNAGGEDLNMEEVLGKGVRKVEPAAAKEVADEVDRRSKARRAKRNWFRESSDPRAYSGAGRFASD